ncbi:MAG: beta-ketoacyl synthase [Variovorax sp.]|nr:MAG: beta-ketoacyl synthase [Variovorax sp.]
MNAMYLGGRGLACALGADVPGVLAQWRAGGQPPVPRTVAPGFVWPLHALAPQQGDWLTRLGRTVRDVVAQSGALDGARRMPLFVASSSLDVGYEEADQRFAGDMHAFADAVAAALDWRGPVLTISTACTSAINAVRAAADWLGGGEAEEALVVGIEFDNCFSAGGFGSMQLLSSTRGRPFGRDRDGLVLGEAVAALRLTRNPSRWRIAGSGNVVEGADPTGTDANAVIAACAQALQDSGLGASDIDLVKVHAAGSPVKDAVELAALRQVFDPLPPLVSFKSLIGHTLGASGAAELVMLTAGVEAGIWRAPDYPLDDALDVGFATVAPPRLRHLLLCAIGFGGGHTALVLEDCGA